jgi:hypothetical protein
MRNGLKGIATSCSYRTRPIERGYHIDPLRANGILIISMAL